MMETANVMPMCCNNGWGNGLGAGVGGFFGAALANGFGGWGGAWNRGGVGGVGYNTALDTAILDGVNGVSNAVNNLNTSNLQGQFNIQAGADRNAAQIINAQNQGFAGLNTAVIQNGYESRLATAAAAAQQAQCCCDLKSLIRDEGCATRNLITQTENQNLRDQLNQERAKIAQLQTQSALQAQTQYFITRYPVPTTTTTTSTTPAA